MNAGKAARRLEALDRIAGSDRILVPRGQQPAAIAHGVALPARLAAGGWPRRRAFCPHDRPPTRPRRAPSPPSPPELRGEGAQLFLTSSAAAAVDRVRCPGPNVRGPSRRLGLTLVRVRGQVGRAAPSPVLAGCGEQEPRAVRRGAAGGAAARQPGRRALRGEKKVRPPRRRPSRPRELQHGATGGGSGGGGVGA